jgi:hypothetical protein
MIKEKRPLKIEYTHAECDACGESLLLDDPRDDIGFAHHGKLIANFGYGHPYDNLGQQRERVVCGTCWQKVLIALDLPVFIEPWGTKLMADGRVVRDAESEKHERACRRPEHRDEPLKESWDPNPKKLD